MLCATWTLFGLLMPLEVIRVNISGSENVTFSNCRMPLKADITDMQPFKMLFDNF